MRPSRRVLKIPDLPPRLGHCEGLTVIGSGSMGTVFRARHTRLNRDVAVKVIDPRLGRRDPALVQRFVREIRLLAPLRNPHVVRILEAGQEGRFTFAVMELIVGQTLERLKQRQQDLCLDPGAAAFYLVQIARGLAAVHEQGIVHRDLKPANVMVDTRGLAKIADFGLARGRDSASITSADEVVGTPEYMAPEMIQQKEVDSRADLYALGILAYELLSGDTPFHEGSVLKVVRDQVETRPSPLQERNPAVPEALSAAIHRLMEKDPDARFGSAAEAAEAFRPFAALAAPHNPTPEVRLPGNYMPSWEELVMVSLLVRGGVYPLDDLLVGLQAWRELKHKQPPFLAFLCRQAGLELVKARRVSTAARRELVALRNRIAVGNLQGRLPPRQLAACAPERLPRGAQVPVMLAEKGALTWDEAEQLDQQVNQALVAATERALRNECGRLGVAPGTLSQLEDRVGADQFRKLYRGLLETLISQLGQRAD